MLDTIFNLLLIIIMTLAVYGLLVSIRQGKRAEKRGEAMLKALLKKIQEEERYAEESGDRQLPREETN